VHRVYSERIDNIIMQLNEAQGTILSRPSDGVTYIKKCWDYVLYTRFYIHAAYKFINTIQWRYLQFKITVYIAITISHSLPLFLTVCSLLYAHWVLLVCCPTKVHWYRLPTADVPIPGFPKCPRPATATLRALSIFWNFLLLFRTLESGALST
jgi:hypothetical protein